MVHNTTTTAARRAERRAHAEAVRRARRRMVAANRDWENRTHGNRANCAWAAAAQRWVGVVRRAEAAGVEVHDGRVSPREVGTGTTR